MNLRQCLSTASLGLVALGATACTYVTEVQDPPPAPAPVPIAQPAPAPAPEPVRRTVIIEENTETVLRQGTVVDK